jgi:hypothetical protein
MVTLCTVMMGLNYADKGILGFAAQPIMRDFKLSPVEFGYLGSSFFLLFAVSGIVLGFLLMTAMAIGWALCLLPAAGQVGFVGLMATRILLGATQGPATAPPIIFFSSGSLRRTAPFLPDWCTSESQEQSSCRPRRRPACGRRSNCPACRPLR